MYDNILAAMAILKVVISVRSSRGSNISHWVDTMVFISCCRISKMYNSVIMFWSNNDESLMLKYIEEQSFFLMATADQ